MPHSPVSPTQSPSGPAGRPRPVVSRRRLLEGGAAVLGACALSASPVTARAAGRRAAADEPPEWNDFGVFRLGTEPPHATLTPYADVEQALAGDRARSPYRLSLDGTWKFAYADRPEDRDADFHRTDVDDGDWETIPVPSVWQLHGHDFPIYLNITYPYWGPNGLRRGPAAARRSADPLQPGRPVPAHLHRPPRLEGTAHLPPLRGRRDGTTCGSTVNWSATTRTPVRRPSTTSPTTSSRAPTRSPSRSTATPTATGWRTRT
ncbi:Beta-galactosidase [Streptomyces violaceorubidus]